MIPEATVTPLGGEPDEATPDPDDRVEEPETEPDPDSGWVPM